MTTVANKAPSRTSRIMLLTEVTTISEVLKITENSAFFTLVFILSAVSRTFSPTSTAFAPASLVIMANSTSLPFERLTLS
ncbi:hypothetical protein D3C74_456250 [compost metagenome]